MYKISRTGLLLTRSFSSTYPLRSCGPPRCCGCPSKPKKRGVFEFLKDPCGIKPDPCNPCPPPLTQNQKICKFVILGARVAFVTGLLYWSARQGAFSGPERRKAFFERLSAAIDVLMNGPKICEPKKCPGCCKCEGGPLMQRLRAALCFLRYDAMSPSEVERAIKCKTLPKNFRRCEACSVPPPPPCPRKKGKPFDLQHWAPERCRFCSTCPCGTRPDDSLVAKIMQERKYNEVEYVDDYYKILKDEEEGGDKGDDSKSTTSKGKKSAGGGDEDQQEEEPAAEDEDDGGEEEEEEEAEEEE